MCNRRQVIDSLSNTKALAKLEAVRLTFETLEQHVKQYLSINGALKNKVISTNISSDIEVLELYKEADYTGSSDVYSRTLLSLVEHGLDILNIMVTTPEAVAVMHAANAKPFIQSIVSNPDICNTDSSRFANALLSCL